MTPLLSIASVMCSLYASCCWREMKSVEGHRIFHGPQKKAGRNARVTRSVCAAGKLNSPAHICGSETLVLYRCVTKTAGEIEAGRRPAGVSRPLIMSRPLGFRGTGPASARVTGGRDQNVTKPDVRTDCSNCIATCWRDGDLKYLQCARGYPRISKRLKKYSTEDIHQATLC